MRPEPHAEAAFPGQRLAFAVTPGPGGSSDPIRWAGGGEPFTGEGLRFTTTFREGGSYTVTATSGSESLGFLVTVCPLGEWLDDASEFFGASLDLSKVTVRASPAVFGPPGTGWTCNTVVRFKRPRTADDLPSQSTFIHELAHVWQHQSGQAQLLKGMIEQAGRILGRNPYDFGGPDGVRSAAGLPRLRKEAQAEIVRELWRSRHGFDSDRMRRAFSTPGYREDMTRLVEEAGIGRSAPGLRRTMASRVDATVARLVNALLSPLE
jgi:hypothetical protein